MPKSASNETPDTPSRDSSPGEENKAAFIRSLPPDMPAKEVVQRAKAKGLNIEARYVYKARRLAKAGKRGAARRGSGGASARVSRAVRKGASAGGRRKPDAGKKRAFVMSLPADTPAKDVVAAAKKSRITMSPKDVYNIRQSLRAKGAAIPTPKRASVRRARPAAPAQGRTLDDQFIDLLLRIGLDRAQFLTAKAAEKLKSL